MYRWIILWTVGLEADVYYSFLPYKILKFSKIVILEFSDSPTQIMVFFV